MPTAGRADRPHSDDMVASGKWPRGRGAGADAKRRGQLGQRGRTVRSCEANNRRLLARMAPAEKAMMRLEVFRRFKELSKGKTAVLISHRFSSVRMADRFLVLADGKVEAAGHTKNWSHRVGAIPSCSSYRLHYR
jgi:hypothetical protein